jgi:tRNA A37 threonylcarbamoyladenosine synthetase subunit TsaC/SUA5/YrdC
MDYINRNLPTRIDCIYDGKSTNNKLVSLIKDINDRIEILSGSNSFEDFKINIRDWRLKRNIY